VPVLERGSLPAHAATNLSECPPVSLNGASHVELVVEGAYGVQAKAGMRVHIRSSIDGMAYDTADLLTFENDFRAGALSRKTVTLQPPAPFIRAFIENLDAAESLSQIKLTAVLSGQ
jgi:hypothetical protein